MPLRNAFAVTGSVNQHGDVQPVGAVNEKIEGFFDVCQARGLTGRQGVVIPAANVTQLMLQQRVVDAVAAHAFTVHAVTTVDQALEVLTGMPEGLRDATGRFPPASLNARIEQRLAGFADRVRSFATPQWLRRRAGHVDR